MFSKKAVKDFKHDSTVLSWGQDFYQQMKLKSITGPDKSFCDRLRNEKDDKKAKAMVESRIDYTHYSDHLEKFR